MKYQILEQYKQEFPIIVMCRVLDVRGKWLLCLAKASGVSTPARRCPTHRRDSTSGNCDEKLIETALEQALARRRPQIGLLHHSDRGSQYTSQAYQACLEQSGIHASMSRKGNCWDNAVMESFFGTVKEECVGSTIYSSHDEARLELFTYIEVYYNRVRRHSTLGYVSPLAYEQKGK